MVMMKIREVGPLLDTLPDRSSVAYRNAWQTVTARLNCTKDLERREALEELHDRLIRHGMPLEPPRMTREQALARANEVNQARAAGRARAGILRRIEAAQFGRISVSSEKPVLFETALQMVEDGDVSFQSCAIGNRRGPKPADDKEPIRRVWLGPKGAFSKWSLEWKSKRRQAEEEAI